MFLLYLLMLQLVFYTLGDELHDPNEFIEDWKKHAILIEEKCYEANSKRDGVTMLCSTCFKKWKTGFNVIPAEEINEVVCMSSGEECTTGATCKQIYVPLAIYFKPHDSENKYQFAHAQKRSDCRCNDAIELTNEAIH